MTVLIFLVAVLIGALGQFAYQQYGGSGSSCSASCPDGSSCSVSCPAGQSASCGCPSGTAVCTCHWTQRLILFTLWAM